MPYRLIVVILLIASVAARGDDKKFALIGSDTLVAQNASPGGTVAWIGAANEPRNGYTRMAIRDGLVIDDDRDGAVIFPLPYGVAPRSVWAAVDVRSGDVAVASSKIFRLKVKHSGELVVRDDKHGKPHALSVRAEWAELLLVRPGVGAWRSSAADGAASDEGAAADGLIDILLQRLRPLALAVPSSAISLPSMSSARWQRLPSSLPASQSLAARA
jgi:hypothetical protein